MSSPKPERPTATNVPSTLFTRLLNIRKVRKARPLKEEDVMTESNQVTEDKPNPFSERKPKPPKKSLLDYNVTSAKPEDVSLSEELNQSSSWTSSKSERTEPARVMLSTNDQPI